MGWLLFDPGAKEDTWYRLCDGEFVDTNEKLVKELKDEIHGE